MDSIVSYNFANIYGVAWSERMGTIMFPYTNAHPDSHALIIGSGTSTQALLQHRGKLHNRWDVVIGVNWASPHFEDDLDYHLVIERSPNKAIEHIRANPNAYRKDLPRLISEQCIDQWPQHYNLTSVRRYEYENPGPVNIRSYGQGFMMRYTRDRHGPTGTVGLQALHLAGILGCSMVDLIGYEHCFLDPATDHYYTSDHYRKGTNTDDVSLGRIPILTVTHPNGSKVQSVSYFVDSARYIDDLIREQCATNGMIVRDMSGGLLTAAQQAVLSE